MFTKMDFSSMVNKDQTVIAQIREDTWEILSKNYNTPEYDRLDYEKIAQKVVKSMMSDYACDDDYRDNLERAVRWEVSNTDLSASAPTEYEIELRKGDEEYEEYKLMRTL